MGQNEIPLLIFLNDEKKVFLWRHNGINVPVALFYRHRNGINMPSLSKIGLYWPITAANCKDGYKTDT